MPDPASPPTDPAFHAVAAPEKAQEKAPAPPPVPITDYAEARAFVTRTRPGKHRLISYEGRQLAIVRPPHRMVEQINMATMKYDASGAPTVNSMQRIAKFTIACLFTVGQNGQPAQRILNDADEDVLLGEAAEPDSLLTVVGVECLLWAGGKKADDVEAAKKA